MDQAKADSIHLENWPVADEKYLDDTLESEMQKARDGAAVLHAERKKRGLSLKQPLSFASLASTSTIPREDINNILISEVNIDKIEWIIDKKQPDNFLIRFNDTITEELKSRKELREVMRVIQDLRREANVAFDALVDVELPSWPKEFEDEIKKKTLVKRLVKGDSKKILASN